MDLNTQECAEGAYTEAKDMVTFLDHLGVGK